MGGRKKGVWVCRDRRWNRVICRRDNWYSYKEVGVVRRESGCGYVEVGVVSRLDLSW